MKTKRRPRGGSQSLLNMCIQAEYKAKAAKAVETLDRNIINNIDNEEEFRNILILGLFVYVLNTDGGHVYHRDDLKPEHFTINQGVGSKYYFFNTKEDADYARNQLITFLRDNLFKD